ncbi:MAG: M55 family metallopeptidase [Ilumatobacteraceae bacterium]
MGTNVYLSVDMEGVTGVAHADELTADTVAWQRARQWMTADVIAVAEGAMAGGASRVVVVDGHAGMRNVLFDDMPRGVELHRGPASGRRMCQVEGLDASFGAVLCVGYHSRAGTAGLLSHTWHGGVVVELRLAGRPIGETAITATIAGHHGVPVVFASGDQVLAAEAAADVPGITTVVVKESTGRQNARCLPAVATREMLAEAAERAVRDAAAVAPLAAPVPAPIEIDVTHSRHADRIVRFLGDRIRRIGPQTVAFEQPDAVAAFELAWLAVELADMEPSTWNR